MPDKKSGRKDDIKLVFESNELTDTITTNLMELSLPTLTTKNNLRMDLGNTEAIDFKWHRTQPTKWTEGDDIQYADSEKWSNRKWLEVLTGTFIDRWQMNTDGCKINYIATGADHQMSFTLNGYIKACNFKYDISSPSVVSGNMKIQIGSAYTRVTPSRPENMRKITYVCEDDHGALHTVVMYARDGETIRLIAVPVEWVNMREGFRAVGWMFNGGHDPLDPSTEEPVYMPRTQVKLGSPGWEGDIILHLGWAESHPVKIKYVSGGTGSHSNVDERYELRSYDMYDFLPLPVGWESDGDSFNGWGIQQSNDPHDVIMYQPYQTIVLFPHILQRYKTTDPVTGEIFYDVEIRGIWNHVVKVHANVMGTTGLIMYKPVNGNGMFVTPTTNELFTALPELYKMDVAAVYGYATSPSATEREYIIGETIDAESEGITDLYALWYKEEVEIIKQGTSNVWESNGTLNTSGYYKMTVFLQGGGGGGGSGSHTAITAGNGGGGGGGGEFKHYVIRDIVPSYTFSVGAGGQSNTNGGNTRLNIGITDYLHANGGLSGKYGGTDSGAGGVGGTGGIGPSLSLDEATAGGSGGKGGDSKDRGGSDGTAVEGGIRGSGGVPSLVGRVCGGGGGTGPHLRITSSGSVTRGTKTLYKFTGINGLFSDLALQSIGGNGDGANTNGGGGTFGGGGGGGSNINVMMSGLSFTNGGKGGNGYMVALGHKLVFTPHTEKTTILLNKATAGSGTIMVGDKASFAGLTVYMQGGGGGGAGNGANTLGGGGGGGGEHRVLRINDYNASYQYTVGKGGVGSGTGGTGASGTNTTFGSFIAMGGGGGSSNNPGAGGSCGIVDMSVRAGGSGGWGGGLNGSGGWGESVGGGNGGAGGTTGNNVLGAGGGGGGSGSTLNISVEGTPILYTSSGGYGGDGANNRFGGNGVYGGGGGGGGRSNAPWNANGGNGGSGGAGYILVLVHRIDGMVGDTDYDVSGTFTSYGPNQLIIQTGLTGATLNAGTRIKVTFTNSNNNAARSIILDVNGTTYGVLKNGQPIGPGNTLNIVSGESKIFTYGAGSGGNQFDVTEV